MIVVKRFGTFLKSQTRLVDKHFQCSYSFESICQDRDGLVKNKSHNLSGIFPAISTPFKRLKNEAVSFKNLEKNLINWSTINFAGYAVHGFYGEYPYLSNEERFEVIKLVRDIVGKKKKIIVGSSSESLKKSIDICELMAKCGADYSLLFTPHYYKKQMTYSALFDYFTKVADKSPLPIIIHNIPSVTFIDMPVELCLDLAHHPNIVGLKECSHNIAKLACMCEHLTKTNTDFSVFTGSASFILDGLRVGAVGSINAVSSFLGPLVVDLYEMYLMEDEFRNKDDASQHEVKLFKEHKEKMIAIQNRLIAPDMIINEYGVAGLKAAMDLLGYYGGPCRSPLSDLNHEEMTNLKLILEQNEFIATTNSNESNQQHV